MVTQVRNLLIPALLSALSLHAQTMPAVQREMIWDRGSVVSIHLGPSPHLETDTPGARALARLKAPDGTTALHHWDGASWATVRHGSGPERQTVLYRSVHHGPWEREATYLAPQGHPLALYPLQANRFLGFSPNGFVKGDKGAFWAIFSRDMNARLHLDALVDLDLKEPLGVFIPPREAQQPGKVGFNPKYKVLAAMALGEGNAPVRVPGFIVVVGHRPGYLWVYRDTDGAFLRRIQVIRTMSDDLLAKVQEIEWAILGCQPRSNGHLLVAARSENAVLNSLKTHGHALNLADMKDPEKFQEKMRRNQRALEDEPNLHWWDVDPETGDMFREVPPLNVPDRFWDPAQLSKFRFVFRSNGDLSFE